MPYSAKKVVMEGNPTYSVHLSNHWHLDPTPGEDAGSVWGVLTLHTTYYGPNEADPSDGETTGAGAVAEADARVQDLLNRLAAALEGTAWQVDLARKSTEAVQTLTADEPEV